MAQGFTGDALAFGTRQGKCLSEQFGWQLATPRGQHQPLVPLGKAAGREFAIGVITDGALIGAVEQRAVGPFKIEHQTQRFAHVCVCEGAASATAGTFAPVAM